MDVRGLVSAALDEDLGPGDLTTMACVPSKAAGEGRIVARQHLVVCGHEAARETFAEAARRLHARLAYSVLKEDGTPVKAGTEIARLKGSLRALLVGERLALNFMMRLCGIATHVQEYVAAAGGELRVVDTRKTTPMLRQLEKYAVRVGGAHNHRFALYDGVLIKDNHIAAAGGIDRAVRRTRGRIHHLARIEIEVSTIEQLDEALNAGVDAVLLDNMDDDLLSRCIAHARRKAPAVVLEASGNMTPERIRRLQTSGLDLVSAGALTHQATWADLALEVVQSG